MADRCPVGETGRVATPRRRAPASRRRPAEETAAGTATAAAGGDTGDPVTELPATVARRRGRAIRGSGWLCLVYRVPSEPPRLRATVWRRVRGLGAIYLQNSVAALPDTPPNERALRALRRSILEMGGTAVLLRSQALAGEDEVVAAFQAARDDEYEEIVDRARDFLAQVEKEHVAEHFSYAELEENEVDLTKLQSWLAKVRLRDTFGASGLAAAEQVLVECERALEAYAAQVYARESEGH